METLIINQPTISEDELIPLGSKIFSILELLQDEYPRFENWFFDTVFPEIGNSRSLILKIYKKELVGLSILKNEPLEKKICTLRVKENFQGIGVGSELLVESCRLLQTNRPLITVSEHRMYQFKKLLERYNFKFFAAYPDYYIKGVTEYSFNGPIESLALLNKTENQSIFCILP